MLSRLRQVREFIREDLWHYEAARKTRRAPRHIIFLRVLSLAWEGLQQNQLFTRAAALSYSTLIGLGPLIAIVVMISGSYFKGDAETRIKEALLFVAPTLREYVTVSQGGAEATPEEAGELDRLIAQIIEGSEATIGQINTAGGRAVGIIGFFVLVFIGIQLLISIEKTFNSIWGVARGRQWTQRVVFYWTFITLGVLLGFGSTALLSASALNSLFEWLPFGATFTAVIITLMPLISLAMLILLLTFGYQFFPNTTVRFRPALIGASIVAILLLLNNYFSIVYVQQVIRMQSLYGSVGIILVMMVGIYFFWVFTLFGAQVTYAIQNVDFLTHREVWQKISVRTQETVTLAAWLLIARRFASSSEPPSAPEISEYLKVPGNVVNTALSVLVDNRWVTPFRQNEDEGLEETYYRPSRPLRTFTLAGYQSLFANHGNSRGADFIRDADPLLGVYRQIQKPSPEGEAVMDFDALFDRHPIDPPESPASRIQSEQSE